MLNYQRVTTNRLLTNYSNMWVNKYADETTRARITNNGTPVYLANHGARISPMDQVWFQNKEAWIQCHSTTKHDNQNSKQNEHALTPNKSKVHSTNRSNTQVLQMLVEFEYSYNMWQKKTGPVPIFTKIPKNLQLLNTTRPPQLSTTPTSITASLGASQASHPTEIWQSTTSKELNLEIAAGLLFWIGGLHDESTNLGIHAVWLVFGSIFWSPLVLAVL